MAKAAFDLLKGLLSECEKHFDEVVSIRRDLHQHPEIAFDVHRTAQVVADQLAKVGIPCKTGIGKTGVVGDIEVPGASRRIALRADMDALPIQELADVPFRSIHDGRAHLCGHDAHTAMLIGAARLLAEHRSRLRCHVRLIFQPSEELFPGGALGMIADGVLDGVDAIFAQHVWSKLPTGYYGVSEGPVMAQSDFFSITIQGKGGHASIPSECIDPIVIGSQVVNALQMVIPQEISSFEPAVITVTRFHAGEALNAIPKTAMIEGTVRTYSVDVQKRLMERMEEVVSGITRGYGATYSLDYRKGYPVTVNHPEATECVRNAAQSIGGQGKLEYPSERALGGEDFSYYAQKVPGCMIWLGCQNEKEGCARMLHDPHFVLDERCLLHGMALHAALALQE